MTAVEQRLRDALAEEAEGLDESDDLFRSASHSALTTTAASVASGGVGTQ